MSEIAGGPYRAWPVRTTDATAKELIRYLVSEPDVIKRLSLNVMGHQVGSNNGACFVARALVQRNGGGAPTLVGLAVDPATNPQNWGGPSAAIVGNEIVFSVTGLAATTIDWGIVITGEQFP